MNPDNDGTPNEIKVFEAEYDALGRRIRRRVYDSDNTNPLTPPNGAFEQAYDDYYSAAYQRIETYTTADPSGVAVKLYEQFVYHANPDAYVDALLVRHRDTTGNGSANENRYSLFDAQYNVVATIDGNNPPTVEERYTYTPYGTRYILTPAYAYRAASADDWDVGHQGLIHDTNYGNDRQTGLLYNRARILDPQLGRFLQRDPLGYVDGMSMYEYQRSAPTERLDPGGTFSTTGGRGQLPIKRERPHTRPPAELDRSQPPGNLKGITTTINIGGESSDKEMQCPGTCTDIQGAITVTVKGWNGIVKGRGGLLCAISCGLKARRHALSFMGGGDGNACGKLPCGCVKEVAPLGDEGVAAFISTPLTINPTGTKIRYVSGNCQCELALSGSVTITRYRILKQ